MSSDANCAQYPVITANEVPRDQRLPPARRHQESNRGADIKKARRHKKGRASEGSGKAKPSSNQTADRAGPSSPTPGSLQRNPSSTSSGGTRRSQLVDLVVENTEAEEEDRAQTQRTYGSAHAEPEPRRFSYVQHQSLTETRSSELLTLVPISRRPSGEPIEEEGESATPPESNSEANQRSRWSYGDLEQDNVWG